MLAVAGYMPLVYGLLVLLDQMLAAAEAPLNLALFLAALPALLAHIYWVSFRCPRCRYPFNLRSNTFIQRGCPRCELRNGEIPSERERVRVSKGALGEQGADDALHARWTLGGDVRSESTDGVERVTRSITRRGSNDLD